MDARTDGDRFDFLIEQVHPGALFLLDAEGRIQSWSEGGQRLTGLTPGEVIGQPLEVLFTPEDSVLARQQLAEAAGSGSCDADGWRRGPAGGRVWVQARLVARRSAEGRLEGYGASLVPAVPTPAAAEPVDGRFAMMVGAVSDYAMFLLDPEGRVLTWNLGAERIKGYRAEEILGSHVSRFYTAEDRAAGLPARLLEQARAQGRVEYEGWRVRKDGTRFWADVVITAIRDPAGELVGFGKVTRDLSQRREVEETLRQSEERFRLMVEAVKDYAIFMLDPKGRIATWNSGAERIKGYTAAEVLGQSIALFYPEEVRSQGKVERELARAVRDGRLEDEDWRVRKDGSRFWANVVLTPLYSAKGELLGFTKITRDLTELKKLEEERLRGMKAREAIRMRDEFLSIASHELKTPLTALQIQLEMLSESREGLDMKAVRKVDRAAKSLQRLVELVETLLDVSRIATGRFELQKERFDLVEIAREVVERLGEAAAQAGCELRLVAPSPAVGIWDRLRVEQVLMNLLSNSMKYAAGSPVRIAIEACGEEVRIEVQDGGPGIPEGELARIFERFERAASMRHYGGLGLGLYVNRQIVETHGGSIVGSNAPTGGAVFTVTLPCEPRVQPPRAQVEEQWHAP